MSFPPGSQLAFCTLHYGNYKKQVKCRRIIIQLDIITIYPADIKKKLSSAACRENERRWWKIKGAR